MELSKFEEDNVFNSYQEISKCFDNTRSYIWPSVKDFYKNLTNNAYILDAGCGNGKNMLLDENILKNKNIKFKGFDITDNLIDIAKNKVNQYYNKINYNNIPIIYKGNIINIPEEDEIFDYVISIAVIHHLDTFEKRVKSILECLRVLKSKGQFMFQIWSFEQEKTKFKFNKGDNMIPWKIRRKDIEENIKGSEKNDIIKIVDRYYYISDYDDIKKLIDTCLSYNTSKLINVYNEMGNWIVILEKL